MNFFFCNENKNINFFVYCFIFNFQHVAIIDNRTNFDSRKIVFLSQNFFWTILKCFCNVDNIDDEIFRFFLCAFKTFSNFVFDEIFDWSKFEIMKWFNKFKIMKKKLSNDIAKIRWTITEWIQSKSKKNLNYEK